MLRDFRNQLLHRGRGAPFEDPRGVLQVHQHDIGAAGLQQRDATPQQHFVRFEIVTPQDRVGPYLPDHEVGMLREDVALEPGKLLFRILPPLAAVDDADRNAGQALFQGGLQPARVIQARIASADTLR